MPNDPMSVAWRYRMALEAIAKAKTIGAAQAEAMAALEYDLVQPDEGQFVVTSGFGQAARIPFVSITTPTTANQLPIDQARQIAGWIVKAAAAAEAVAFLIEFFSTQMDFDDQHIGALLTMLRKYREDHADEPPA